MVEFIDTLWTGCWGMHYLLVRIVHTFALCIVIGVDLVVVGSYCHHRSHHVVVDVFPMAMEEARSDDLSNDSSVIQLHAVHSSLMICHRKLPTSLGFSASLERCFVSSLSTINNNSSSNSNHNYDIKIKFVNNRDETLTVPLAGVGWLSYDTGRGIGVRFEIWKFESGFAKWHVPSFS